MDKKKLLISLLALCTCSPFLGRGFGGEASAQEVYTLKSCLEKGLQNNYSLRIIHNEDTWWSYRISDQCANELFGKDNF